MEEYPKIIKIENEKLKKLLFEKGAIITIGRTKSEELEVIEKEMAELEEKIKGIEQKVKIEDLQDKSQVVTDKINKCVAEMDKLKQEHYDRMKKEVPEELGIRYDELKTKKEELETERNKKALKAQKYNDKIIPLGKKLMKPYISDIYDDYDTMELKDGEIFCSIFNHLEDFKNNFKKK